MTRVCHGKSKRGIAVETPKRAKARNTQLRIRSARPKRASRNWRNETFRVGEEVWRNTPVMELPDLSGMEVMAEVKHIIAWLNETGTARFECEEGLVGGSAYDAHKVSITEDTMALAKAADSVIFGAVAGVYVDRLDRRLILVTTNAIRAVPSPVTVSVDSNKALIGAEA